MRRNRFTTASDGAAEAVMRCNSSLYCASQIDRIRCSLVLVSAATAAAAAAAAEASKRATRSHNLHT